VYGNSSDFGSSHTVDAPWGFTRAAIEIDTSAMSNATCVRITDCHLHAVAGDGILISCTYSAPTTAGAQVVLVSGCRIQGNDGWGIDAPATPGTEGNYGSLVVTACDIEGNYAGGINADWLHASSITGNHFEGNVVNSLQLGLHGQCHGLTIANNYLSGANAYLVDMYGPPVDASGFGSSSGIVIQANRFHGSPGAKSAVRSRNHAPLLLQANVLEGTFAPNLGSSQLLEEPWDDGYASGLGGLVTSTRLLASAADYALADRDGVVIYEGPSAVNLVLPDPATSPLQIGKQYTVKNWSAAAVTLRPQNNANIDGALQWTLPGYLNHVTVVYAGKRPGQAPRWAVVASG
jgi:hypothetical protein